MTVQFGNQSQVIATTMQILTTVKTTPCMPDNLGFFKQDSGGAVGSTFVPWYCTSSALKCCSTMDVEVFIS